MSELAIPTQQGGLELAMLAPSVDLAAWVADLDAAHKIGTALCGTEFAPAAFRGKPDAAAAAILTGKSLGLDPMNALSNIFVVQGRPALYARTMAALVMQAGHHLRRAAATDESVTVQARRRGDAEWQDFTWDIGRATKAGYTGNKKYLTDPQAMLTAKAFAEACRTIAPDVLTGIAAVSAEEVELEDLGEKPSAPAPEPKRRTASARLRKQAEPAPEPEPLPEGTDINTIENSGTLDGPSWYDLADAAGGDEASLRALYDDAQSKGADAETLEYIKSKAA